MASAVQPFGYLRPGLTSVTPYIVIRDASGFINFLKTAFRGTERLRIPASESLIAHAEVAIGNGVVELSDTTDLYPVAPCAIHLYLDDPDVAYTRALEAGAESLYPVADQEWGDRQGAVKDQFGNHWYIATPNGWTPGPEGIRNVQPYLHLNDARSIVPFLEQTFEATTEGMAQSPEGAVLHATIRIGNATLEIDEAHGDFQPMPCNLHVYVPDTDAAYSRALKLRAKPIEPPQDKMYGDRAAIVKDSWGNTWFIATQLGR